MDTVSAQSFFTATESVRPMPHQVRRIRPVVAFAGKLDLSAGHLFEQERSVAGFVEAFGRRVAAAVADEPRAWAVQIQPQQ